MEQYVLLGLLGIWMVALFIVLPYFQRRRQRQLLAGLEHGDSVIVLNGILGKVNRVDGGIVEVEIAPKVKIRCLPSVVSKAR